MGRRKGLPINGWLIIDKDLGQSSAQVVAAVRRITGAAKAGHGGTLDPLASGVLPIALGEATKTVNFALDGAKSYQFTACWGEERDTDDAEGQVMAMSGQRPSRAEIEAALDHFTGSIEQLPPAFSALKIDGQRAYKLARAGEDVILEPRVVQVYEFKLLNLPDASHAVFSVECGKGTYIRALARDLGRMLGCYSYVSQLRRTRVGPYGLSAAISLAKLDQLWHGPPPFEHLLPIETALDDIPALALTGPQADRLRSGQPIKGLDTEDGLVCAMYGGRPVALSKAVRGEIHPVRVFNL